VWAWKTRCCGRVEELPIHREKAKSRFLDFALARTGFKSNESFLKREDSQGFAKRKKNGLMKL
jgi:hypothetical protein